MTEYFRIEGLNDINFDEGSTGPYRLGQGVPPRDLSRPLTRQEIVAFLPALPRGIRTHALNREMSKVTFPFDIQGDNDVEMEQALHDLVETLRAGQAFIESESARGTRAVLRYKADNAVQDSYKTIYYGKVEEAVARDVLGPRAKESLLTGLQLTLYMEPMWRPEEAVALGPNEIYCPGMEEDGNADGLADNWALLNVPTATMEDTIVLQGFYSQKLVTRNLIGDGIQSDAFAAPAASTSCIAYAWIARPAAGSDIIVEVYDSTAPGVRGSALYDTGGWDEALAKDGVTTFYRVEVPVAAGIVGGNNHRMRIYNTAATATTLYVDKCYLKWDTTTAPVEWSDHWRLFNHYDTTAGAAHEGHQNYFDVCDLKGTDEARLLIQTEWEQAADMTRTADLIIARRNWWEIARASTSDNHWLEAEDATTLNNWAALGGLARCSSGDCVSDNANVAGNVTWQFFSTPAGVQYDAEGMRGRYDVFAMVYTDDAEHTQYRLGYTNFGGLLGFFGDWVKQPDDNQWQMVYLGEVNLDKFLRAGFVAAIFYVAVEYAKDAADTVRLDCIWLLPKTDPETRLHTVAADWLVVGQYWAIDRTEDFDYEEKEGVGIVAATQGELCLQGDVPTLSPHRVHGQRLYFCCESIDTGPTPDERVWEAHGAATDLQLRVDVSYLPQYQTPLD